MMTNGLLNIEIGTLSRLCSKIGLPRTTFHISLRKVAIMVCSSFGQVRKPTKKQMKLSHNSLIPKEIDRSRKCLTTALVRRNMHISITYTST